MPMSDQSAARSGSMDLDEEPGITLGEILAVLRPRAKLLIAGPLAAGAVALGVTYLIPPTFTAATTFLPPQQAQSSAASALASLGALTGFVGATAGVKSPAEQYVALMQSVTVSDRIIDRYKLTDVYDAKYRVDARKELAENVRISVGRKDGLITIAVDDHSPQRAADMRLPCPWDSPGKNTGVGCHFLLQRMKEKSESEVAQSCPTLSDQIGRAHV